MKVLKIKENKDGSATISYELNADDEYVLRALAKSKKKRYTKKFINDCILEGITNMLKEEEMKLKPFVVQKEVKRRINKQIKDCHYIISDGKNAVDGDTLK